MVGMAPAPDGAPGNWPGVAAFKPISQFLPPSGADVFPAELGSFPPRGPGAFAALQAACLGAGFGVALGFGAAVAPPQIFSSAVLPGSPSAAAQLLRIKDDATLELAVRLWGISGGNHGEVMLLWTGESPEVPPGWPGAFIPRPTFSPGPALGFAAPPAGGAAAGTAGAGGAYASRGGQAHRGRRGNGHGPRNGSGRDAYGLARDLAGAQISSSAAAVAAPSLDCGRREGGVGGAPPGPAHPRAQSGRALAPLHVSSNRYVVGGAAAGDEAGRRLRKSLALLNKVGNCGGRTGGCGWGRTWGWRG